MSDWPLWRWLHLFRAILSSASHTGIVEAVSSTQVTTIEGNSSDQVARRVYSRSASNIVGYGKPKFTTTITEPEEPKVSTTPTYSNSALTAVTIYSPNNSGIRTHTIDRISPHCVVGQCTAEALGAWFAKSSTQASSNYGIDKDGRVGLYVDESKRSWCTSSNANDQRAVTIECASDTTSPYRMNDCVYLTLIDLCADICKRNGKKKLIWIPNKDQALAYEPKSDEMLITVHRWFANKSCPGDWLYSRLGDLAAKVTAKLNPTTVVTPVDEEEEEEEMTQEKFNEMMDAWLAAQAAREPSAWSKEAREWAESNGYIAGDEKGRKMYKKPLTREEFVQVLYRIEN